MSPKKKQRTGKDSSAATEEHEEEQPNEPDASNEQGEAKIQTDPALIDDESSDDGPDLPNLHEECSQCMYTWTQLIVYRYRRSLSMSTLGCTARTSTMKSSTVSRENMTISMNGIPRASMLRIALARY
jgi:hypothetical protein